MKVYVDLLFIVNILFDFLLLLSTSLILRRNVKLYRLILGSLVGGISIILLFFNINSVTFFFIKIIIAVLMCITSFNYRDIRYTLKNIIYLYIVSIFLGGILYVLNIEFSYKNNGLVFYNNGFSINFIVILIISPILMYFYVKEMKSLKNNYSKYYDVDIYFKSGNCILKGFLDTGNNLVDPYKKRPIVIVYYDKISKYLSNEKELLVPYTNINNSNILRCIRVKKILVNDIEFKNILVGFSFNKIHIDGVDCILNNNMEGLC